MNIAKRNDYKLKSSFHTLEIRSPEFTQTEDKEVSNCINTHINSAGTVATSKINPNKLMGDVLSFSDFCKVFDEIITCSGIDKYRITRADMRFDSYEKEHYRAYAKLNKYIISALALTYSVKNKYKTTELFSGSQISIAIKNDYFEVENYDRDWKNKVTGNTTETAKARLEERTVARRWRKINEGIDYSDSDYNMSLLKQEFTDGWEARWEKAKVNIKLVQEAYNDALVKKYNEGKNSRPVQFRSLTDFLIQNQESIFTSMQMVDLLKRLGVENPEERAKYHKKKYGIEYFSQKDVDYAINEIKRATNEFFGN